MALPGLQGVLAAVADAHKVIAENKATSAKAVADAAVSLPPPAESSPPAEAPPAEGQ